MALTSMVNFLKSRKSPIHTTSSGIHRLLEMRTPHLPPHQYAPLHLSAPRPRSRSPRFLLAQMEHVVKTVGVPFTAVSVTRLVIAVARSEVVEFHPWTVVVAVNHSTAIAPAGKDLDADAYSACYQIVPPVWKLHVLLSRMHDLKQDLLILLLWFGYCSAL